MAIRKDANTLSSAERTELVDAILQLKASGIYDAFVLRHANAVMSAIHRSPAFLPWHRRFIWDYERELQRVSGNPDLGLPYWNWPRGDGSASMWDADLLGGNGDPLNQVVQTGPFRQGQWTVVSSGGALAGPLTRAFGRASWARTLPTDDEIDQVLALTPYDVPNWDANSDPSFRNHVEGFRGPNLHNRGHGWVGGSMLPMTSPNDPVFFIHHCMVDKLWHEWQLRFPSQGYQPISGGPFGQNLSDPMDSTPLGPIGNRPVDVLDSAALGIEYDSLLPGTPPQDGSGTGSDLGQELIVGADTVNAAIGAPGEVDLFRFDVGAFGVHTIETSGSSDTVITLSGPDDRNDQIGLNDDGGVNLNSRLSMALSAGRYFIRVRLFSASRTGSYGIEVRAEGAAAVPELVVGADSLQAAISAGSESDLYRFQAQSSGTYVIETSGTTDTFLTLFGPDSQTDRLAENDDGGFNRNSRISIDLAAAEYFVRIRHFSPQGTGPYQVGVRRL